MIRCRVARAFVEAGLERQLALEERFQLELHTSTCGACAEFERRARALQELLEGPGDPAPRVPDVDAAARAVFAALAQEPAHVAPRRGRPAVALALGVVAAAAVGGCLLFTRTLRSRAPAGAPVAGPAVERLGPPASAQTPDADWTAASVEAGVRAALLELFPSAGVDVAKARARFLERTRAPARAGWPVRRFVEGLLGSPDARVGLGAVRCLAALGEASSVAALERALAREELAASALEALGSLGEPAVPALERALGEPALVAGSLLQLCRVGGARAAGVLERAARAAKPGADPSREALLDALTSTGPAAVASLLRLAEESERSGGRAAGTAVLARLSLVDGGAPALARALEGERLPYDFGYRALLYLQPPEALAWLEERCGIARERALALEALAGFPGLGPLGVGLRLAETGRAPRADVLALLGGLFERDAEHGEQRAAAFTRELTAASTERGHARGLRTWLELLIESAHPGAARALVSLVFCEALGDDDRQWAALAVGEFGTAEDAEQLLVELGGRAGEDRRRTAACLLSIHARLGSAGVERLLAPCSPANLRRVLAALAEAGRAGEAVRVYRVARALDGALAELADASANPKEIL